MPIALIKDYKVMGQMICQHINAKKNQKHRKEVACKLVMLLCEKLDNINTESVCEGELNG